MGSLRYRRTFSSVRPLCFLASTPCASRLWWLGTYPASSSMRRKRREIVSKVIISGVGTADCNSGNWHQMGGHQKSDDPADEIPLQGSETSLINQKSEFGKIRRHLAVRFGLRHSGTPALWDAWAYPPNAPSSCRHISLQEQCEGGERNFDPIVIACCSLSCFALVPARSSPILPPELSLLVAQPRLQTSSFRAAGHSVVGFASVLGE